MSSWVFDAFGLALLCFTLLLLSPLIIVGALSDWIIAALKNPMDLNSTFLSDNIQYLVPIAIIIAIVIFIGILFVLMGGVICSQI